MIRRDLLASLLAGTALHRCAPAASLLRLVVPSAPGGTGDLLPRLFAPHLRTEPGEAVIVENRPGAGGRIGALHVAHAGSGEAVLCAANVSTFAVYPALARRPAYDPFSDFTPVTTLVDAPNVLCLGPGASASTLDALVAKAQAGNEWAYASPGVGSLGHLLGLLFNHATGAKLRHVPYRGAGPALQDVVAGHVPVLFDNLPASLPHIRAGRLRPLLVAAPARLPFLPKVPTFGESGLQDLNHPAWFGLAAPPGWPHYKVRGVVEAVQRAQQQVAVHSRLLELGTLPADAGPEGLNRRIREAMARYGTLGRRAGVILED